MRFISFANGAMQKLMCSNKHQGTFFRNRFGRLTLLLCLGWLGMMSVASKGFAQDHNAYYRVFVPVTAQTVAERERAAKVGLDIVLRRMSDSRHSNFETFLSNAQTKAWSYVQQFEYQAIDPEEDGVASDYVNRLMLLFSPNVIKKLLREAQINFWPESRPTTLVWLVEDSYDNGKQLLNADSESSVLKGLNRAAVRRGLPIAYPILDLEDQMQLSPEQVWGLDNQAILSASERYNADVILVGRFSTTSSGTVRATWQFYHQNDTRVYDNISDDTALIGNLGLIPLADYLLAKYAIPAVSEQSPDIIMRITGVSQFGAYRQVVDYLEGLTIVKQLMVQATGSEELILSVQAETNVDRFIDTVKLGGKLSLVPSLSFEGVPEWQRAARGTAQNPLVYRWSR